MSNAYANDKLSRHPGFVEALRRGENPPPIHAHMILSDLCNQACSFCAYRWPGYTSAESFWEFADDQHAGGLRRDPTHPERNYNPTRWLPTMKAKEILDDLSEMGTRAVQFTGGGEPTVHPAHESIFRYALRKGLRCALVSNGARWSDELVDQILPYFSWVRISLDAATPDTYSAIRRVPKTHYKSALYSIERLAKVKGDCTLGVGFVVTRENWVELGLAAQLAKMLGADNIRIGGVFSPEGAGYYDGISSHIKELIGEARKFEDDGFRVYAQWPDKIGDLEQGAPDYRRCLYQQHTTYIGGDQNVYRCCVLAYNERGKIGTLRGNRFRDVWAAMAPGLREFDATGCERCQFNLQNRSALRLLSGEAQPGGEAGEHDYFV